MMQRVTIEFAVDVPNDGVARDVLTRIRHEHHSRLCEIFQSVTGYAPLLAPERQGFVVGGELVTWDETEQDWVALNDVAPAQ